MALRETIMSYNNGPHYVFSTRAKFSKATADAINEQIQQLDPSAEFVGPLSIPGNDTTGWIERPNDGRNDYQDISRRNREMADIARQLIEEGT